MAHFRGTVQGGRTAASRLGHKTTGLTSKTNGWNSGVTVRASVDDDGRDVFRVYRTGGSNAASADRYVGKVVGDEWIPRSPHGEE